MKKKIKINLNLTLNDRNRNFDEIIQSIIEAIKLRDGVEEVKLKQEKKMSEEKIKGCGKSIGMRNNTKFCGDTHSWDKIQLCDECKKRIKLEGEKND